MTQSSGAEPATAEFSLPASTGQTLSLASFRGKVPLVLVFLEIDREEDLGMLELLNSRHREFGNRRIQVLAVARITAREARQLADEIGLSVPILADASGAMAREHGVGGRAALVTDKEGRVVRRFDPLPADDPSQTIDSLLEAAQGND